MAGSEASKLHEFFANLREKIDTSSEAIEILSGLLIITLLGDKLLPSLGGTFLITHGLLSNLTPNHS